MAACSEAQADQARALPRAGADRGRTALAEDHSPEQIAGWLRCSYPDNEQMQVSHETIYRSLYVQARGQFKRELCRHLRTTRVKRQPRGATRRGQGRGKLADMVPISQRPPEPEPEPIISAAGTRLAVEQSVQHDAGRSTEVGSAREQHQHKVPPNDVRQLPPGMCFAIGSGRAQKLQIAPTDPGARRRDPMPSSEPPPQAEEQIPWL